MIRITNKADEKAKVEILTDIGEGFFSEGITAAGIAQDIKNINGDFDLVISSLGGDAADALTIHDLIKMHPGKVDTTILGLTASSGTVIALAGDSIKMSKNALFLVHNAMTGAFGNTHDFQKISKDLDQVDGRLAGIYSKKTGKRKSQILSLMEREEWLSSDEAKTWGFIDSVFEPETPILNSIFEKVNNSKLLPKIKPIDMDTTKIMNAIGELKNLFTKDKPEDVDTSAYEAKIAEIETEFEGIKTENEAFKAQVETIESEKAAAIEAKTTADTEKTAAIEAKIAIEAEKAAAIEAKATAETERDSIKAEYLEYAKAKLDVLKYKDLGGDDLDFINEGKTATQARTARILAGRKTPTIKDADD